MPVEILNIDCMEFMKRCDGNFFDLAVVDPPYFDGPQKSGYYGNGYSNLGVKRNSYYSQPGSWEIPDENYFKELFRVSKNQIIWGANHFADKFKSDSSCWIVWNKDNGSSSFADAELAYTSFDTAVRIFKYMWNGMHQGSLGGNTKLNEKRIHPTQKPTALYRWIFENYAKPGQKVLDTHLGSGSSAIAAHYYGLNFVGCELDEKCFRAAETRIKKETRQIALFKP